MSEPTAAKQTTSAEQPILSMRDVNIAFGPRKNPIDTVFDIDLDVFPGETVAIVGESGSGKSTTAHAVLDLLPDTGHVTGGQIFVDGQDVSGFSEKEFCTIRGEVVGLVPQDPMSNLNPVWTIGHHIKESLKANNIATGSAAHDRAIELMTEAGLPDAKNRVDMYPHQFSGGMRQRALIACGLAARPKLLIADEPTSALDVTVQQQILDHLGSLTHELGTAMLLITHDLGLAAERAQRIVVMSQGRIVETGPALEVLQDPQHPYTKKLVSAAPSIASHRGDSKVGSVAEADESSAILRVKDLTKIYEVKGNQPFTKSEFTAAEDVSFYLNRGRTLALVGESGSGKSTVAQMVLGLIDVTKGKIEFDGEDITGLSREKELAFRRRVQPVFQNPYGSIDPMYSVFNTIAEPLRIHKIGNKKQQEKRVRELLDMVAMPQSMMHRFPGELSGGQRQRVAIARALALEPEVLILDEAVSALDVLVQSQILALLNKLQSEMGLTYLFITHDLAVVKQVADETLVMKQGRIVERGETDDLFANPEQDYTRRLIDSIPGGKIQLHAG